MIRAQHGLLERQSLEENCLIADGEDMSGLCKLLVTKLSSASDHLVVYPAPVFTRPGPVSRSRSSTCTFSSGGDTPPLSASDGSSISEGSQSSIDLSLSNVTRPLPTSLDIVPEYTCAIWAVSTVGEDVVDSLL